MDLVNLMYRYINRFINGNDLLKELKNIDLKKYTKEEKESIRKLILDLENIIKTVPNETDDIEKQRLSTINKITEVIKNIEASTDEETKTFLDKQYKKLLDDKKVVKDGGKLYENIFQLVTNNELINQYASKMDDKELFKFITQYISVSMPPVIDQECFDDLVKIGINDDERESLWRLAFNYNNKNMDFSLIEDYFIEKKDSYYLIELISAVEEDLNIDSIIKKVIATGDKKFMKDCASRAKKLGIIAEDEIKKLNIPD